MTGEAVTLAGRRAAEARMTCTCVIQAETGEILDEETLLYVDTDALVYQGPCRLKFSTSRVSARDAEGQLDVAQQLLIYLPVIGSENVTVNCTVTITDGGIDPALTGRQYRVSGLFSQTYATARRMPLESLT